MENTNEEEVKPGITDDDVEAFANTEFDENGAPITEERKLSDDVEDTEEEKPEVKEEVEEEAETEEEEEVKPEKPETSDGLKNVAGESPVERARRAEISRLKAEKRELIRQNLLLSQEKTVKNDWKQNLRDRGYTDEQIDEQEKLSDDMALAKGFVSKKDLDNDKINNLFSGFLEEHNEFLPENDKGDVRYTRFYEILKSDYDYKNLANKSPIQIKSIFAKVNRDVIAELGEVENKTKKINAQREKVNAVSASTSGRSVSKPESRTESPKKIGSSHIVGGMKFEGFDDEDFN
jgi:hypothetical protein